MHCPVPFASRLTHHIVVGLSVVTIVIGLMIAPAGEHASATASCQPYPDVSSTNSACANIAWLKDQAITKPADGLYHPLNSVTRGSMAAFLFRLTHPGESAPVCAVKPFPDVAKTNVFCGYIAWATNSHVAFGYSDGHYGPGNAVTRGAMAAYLFRIANPGKGGPQCTKRPFRDVAVSDTFCGVVTWMLSSKITYGIGGNRYGPTLPVTRQAMASFLRRIADLTGVGSSTVTGVVVNTLDKPLSGATVRLGSVSAKSNSTGKFTLVGVPGGSEMRLSASKSGYANASVPVTPMSTKTRTVRVQLQYKSTPSTGTITGAVKDTNGTSLQGVKVYIGRDYGEGSSIGVQYSATTDERGKYVITGVAGNNYYYVCFDSTGIVSHRAPLGYADSCYRDHYWPRRDRSTADIPSIDWVNQNHVLVAAGKTINVGTKLRIAGNISGRVVSAATGRPLKGVAVTSALLNSGARVGNYAEGYTKTAADGTYTLTGLDPTASYAVCFAATTSVDKTPSTTPSVPTGYLNQCYKGHNYMDVIGTAGPTGDTVHVTSARTTGGVNGRLLAGGAIAGSVKDSHGVAVRGATVLVQTNGKVAQFVDTDSQGRYRANALTAGAYSVCVNGGNCVAGSVILGRTTTVNLVIGP